jgi:uncharacterized protein (TIGR02679 family)
VSAAVDDLRLAPLWDELARRMGASSAPVASVTLRGLGEETRRSLADLLGLDRLPGVTFRLPVGALCRALGCDYPGLRERVSALHGPLADRAAARAADRARREELWTWLGDAVAGSGLGAWATRVRAAGVPGGDVAAHRERLATVVAALRALPADGVSLAGFAADVAGDPHGLDYGTWAGSLVVEALARLAGQELPRTAEQARALWGAFGVETDSLSPSVLVLGLAPAGADPLSGLLRAMAAVSEPAAITLAQLRRWPVTTVAPGEVYVFENPSMLAEAASRGWQAPPLVCTSGWPNVAVLTLLRQLAAAGSQLRLHADWDGAGRGIVDLLARRVGGIPWHMPDAGAGRPPSGFEEQSRAELLAAVQSAGCLSSPGIAGTA